jgi:hypothetical protein
MGCAAVQEHRQHKGLNNRAENSHQPTRNRVSAEAPEPRNAVSRSNFFGLAIPPGAPILVRSSNSRSGGHDDLSGHGRDICSGAQGIGAVRLWF